MKVNENSNPLVILENNKVLRDFSISDLAKIKTSVTYPNPAYQNAVKYSKRGYISIPRSLEYFEEFSELGSDGLRHKVLKVPFGTDIAKIVGKPFEVVNNLMSRKVHYPPFLLTLREDQQKAKDSFLSTKSCSGVIQLPTGKGKSILAINLASQLQEKTLVLVHKDDLVVGWKKDLKLCFGEDFKVGIIKAKKKEIGDQVTIATVQTLARMNDEEMQEYTDKFGLVVQDECLVGGTLIVQSDGSVLPMEDCFTFSSVLGGEVSNPFSRKSTITRLECKHLLMSGSPTHKTWCVKKSKERGPRYKEKDFVLKSLSELNSDYLIPIRLTIPHTVTNELSKATAMSLAVLTVLQSFSKEETLVVPSYVFSAPLDSIKVFLETIVNLVGVLSSGKVCRLSLTFRSENYAQSIMLLLKKFEIVCEITLVDFGGVNNFLYRVSVSGLFLDVFMQTFNIHQHLDKDWVACAESPEEQRVERFTGPYFLTEVKQVVDTKREELVYDFTVGGKEHSFIANGCYTHNCHHVGLNIFNIINKFKSKYKLGLSATPFRADGLDFVFDLFFGGICHKHEVRVDDEDISNVKVITRNSPVRYEPFVHNNQCFNYYDFDNREMPEDLTMLKDIDYASRPRLPFLEIDNAVVTDKLNKIFICKDIISEYKKGRSILVLFTQKEHINIYNRYLTHFVPKNQIILYYGDSKEETSVMLKRAETKESLITLATYAKATEGTNVKSWEVEFLVSSCNSEKNLEQATGRIRRRTTNKIEPVLVYDYAYPNVYSLRNHNQLHKRVYKKLKYTYEPSVIKGRGLFERGY